MNKLYSLQLDGVGKQSQNKSCFIIKISASLSLVRETNGDYYDYFIGSYCQLIKRFGKVDGILFHQGESDSAIGNYDYYNDFKIFHEKMVSDGVDTKFYLSQASFCNSQVDSTLLNIQNQIIIDYENVLRGPNTDLLLEPKYRLADNCHFSMLGLEEFSDKWLTSISNKSEY